VSLEESTHDTHMSLEECSGGSLVSLGKKSNFHEDHRGQVCPPFVRPEPPAPPCPIALLLLIHCLRLEELLKDLEIIALLLRVLQTRVAESA
jgi:hypothetical protein